MERVAARDGARKTSCKARDAPLGPPRIIQPKLAIVLRLKNAARSHPISPSPHYYYPMRKTCQFPVQASIGGESGGTKCFF